ncbi:MAG TPA: response regulator [Terriglobales bacterium]|nr:response regulator [Terriglobales bacterium]
MTTKILHIEDFGLFRDYIRQFLKTHSSFQIAAEAHDGIAGVLKAGELQPDIILLDIDLPLLGGIEAARRIAHVAPHARILFLSQQDSPEIIAETFRSGAWAYIRKADVGRELLQALKSVSNGALYINSYSAHRPFESCLARSLHGQNGDSNDALRKEPYCEPSNNSNQEDDCNAHKFRELPSFRSRSRPRYFANVR